MRGRWLGGVSVAVVLLLTGCSSGEPDAAPTTIGGPVSSSSAPAAPESVEVQPSPEPSAVAAPVLPELATQQTPEGAVAFAQWWFDTLNYATMTGDTEALAAASGSECGTCANFIDEIETAYEYGGRIEGGLFTVQISPAGALQDLGVRFPVMAEISATRYVDPAGEISNSLPGEDTPITFTAVIDGGSWLAGGLAGIEK